MTRMARIFADERFNFKDKREEPICRFDSSVPATVGFDNPARSNLKKSVSIRVIRIIRVLSEQVQFDPLPG